METIELILPSWAMVPLFNSDETGILDQQSDQLDEFSREMIDLGYNAIPIGQNFIGFEYSNDLENLAGDCYAVTFQKLSSHEIEQQFKLADDILNNRLILWNT